MVILFICQKGWAQTRSKGLYTAKLGALQGEKSSLPGAPGLTFPYNKHFGEVAERLKAPVLKTGVG